jgi:8-oxo-dGTP diphosphatase
VRGDGNGWVHCRCGHRHWGLHGAAGLLLVRRDAPPGRGSAAVLLQLRAAWTHHGGTWGLPGGARDSHEDVATAALREAHEEVGLEPASVDVVGAVDGADHVDWAYTYVLAWAGPTVDARGANAETEEVRWVRLDDVPALPLHPGLAPAWPLLRRRLADLDARQPLPVTPGAARRAPRRRRPSR